MIFCERLFVNLILVFCCICSTARSQLNEDSYTSDPQCFGAGSLVNGTCPVASSIALNAITVGMKPLSLSCNGNETFGDGTGCCDTAGDRCEFLFPITNNVRYHDQCNGNQACMPGVQRVDIAHAQGACNESHYPRFSQYMFLQYFCVEDSRTGDMSSSQLSVVNDALYIQSPGYPGSNISSSVTELSCSVETDDCSAMLNVYVIERNLADNINSTCYLNQSLSIIEPDGTVLVQWTCSDNTYDISQPTQSTYTYITVNLTNTMATNGGQFWIGFEATIVSNLTIDCPAKERQYCLPTTTTSTTPATTTTTTAITTPTTTTTTTTTPSTTSTTTTATPSTTITSATTTTTMTTTTTPVITTTTTPVITTTTTPVITTPAAAVNETTDIIAAPSPSGQDSIMIIVVCSCLGGVLIITFIIGLVICWKHKKEKVSSEKRTLVDSEEPQDDNQSVKSSLNSTGTGSPRAIAIDPNTEQPKSDNEDNDAAADERETDVSLHSDQNDNKLFEVNELQKDDNKVEVLGVTIVPGVLQNQEDATTSEDADINDPDPTEQFSDNSAEVDASVTISDMVIADDEKVIENVADNENFSMYGMIQVTPCEDADSGRATSLSGDIEELQPMKPSEVIQPKKKKKKNKKRHKKAWTEDETVNIEMFDKIEPATSLNEQLPEEHIPAKALPEETELNEPTSFEPKSKTLPQSDTCIDIETPTQEIVATKSIQKSPTKQRKESTPYQRLYRGIVREMFGDDILEKRIRNLQKSTRRRRQRNSIKPIVKEISSP